MCGIFVYIGGRPVLVTIIQGLYRLEYRGYDSVGISLLKKNSPEIVTIKTAGTVKALEDLLNSQHLETIVKREDDFVLGFGHTRWPTMGAATTVNAQPIWSNDKQWAVVLNGIVENNDVLTKKLKKEGFIFETENDVECVAHLLQYTNLKYPNDTMATFISVLSQIEGAYGICVLHATEQKIFCARLSSPVCLGIGKNEIFISSDAVAFSSFTENVIHLDDHEILIADKNEHKIYKLSPNFDVSDALTDAQGKARIIKLPQNESSADLEGFPHYMLKEIYQQPRAIGQTFAGKIDHVNTIHINIPPNIRKVVFLACGTSYYASLVGRHIIEMKAEVPVLCEYASEFIYRKCLVNSSDLVIAVSQSGETADTKKALEIAISKKAVVAGIVNRVGSSIARLAGCGMYLHAGDEIGVASTKAFSCQICAMILLSALLAKDSKYTEWIQKELRLVPEAIQRILGDENTIKTIDKIVEKFKEAKSALFLGRGIAYPLALEGALKMKEISYIHAEGCAAGEMKHGPIALVDEGMPSFFILLHDDGLVTKVLNNMEEIRTRKGRIITITNSNHPSIQTLSDFVIQVPPSPEILAPLLLVVPLQLIAYRIAIAKGLNPDRPRNLAKSVTVE